MEVHYVSLCIHCKIPSRPGNVRYLLSDMANEMLVWVELKLKFEANEQSWLCEKCFNLFNSAWAEAQEPDIDHVATGMDVDHDPLSVSISTGPEEVKVKIEKPEKHEDKVEIGTHEGLLNIQTNVKNLHKNPTCSEQYDAVVKSDDVVKFDETDSSDYEPDLGELSAEDFEDDLLDIENPTLLDGSSLKYGTRCDCCKIDLTKQKYRRVQNGLVKEQMIVTYEPYARERSPKRVCNTCWTKARTAVIKNKMSCKGKVNTKQGEKSKIESITIPGYRRFVNSSRHCMIQGCENNDRGLVSEYLRIFLLKFYNIYTPDGCRICKEHCKEYVRDWSFLKQHNYLTGFSQRHVVDMLDLLREAALKYPE